MTTALLYALPGLLTAVAALVLIASFAPRQPDLAAAVDRMRTRTTTAPATNVRGRFNASVAARAERLGVQAPKRELELLGLSTEQFYAQKVLGGAVGLLLPTAAGAIITLTTGISIAFPIIIGLVFALILWFVPDITVRDRARKARLEFTRALTVYLDLVAAQIRRNVADPVAIERAAYAADSWVFLRIQQLLERARYEGVPAWRALHELADEIDLPELAEVSQILTLAGEQGASVRDALGKRAQALRSKLLKQYHADERARSTSLALPQVLAGVSVMGLLATPFVLRLTSNFL